MAARSNTWRQGCYSGLAVGLLIAVFRLAFFWHIFSAGSVALWYVFAIGICICYDLSYRRVTDPLIRMGAQALIVPTMDVADWGRRQHELHARVAPVRAAEYGVPIFRLPGFSRRMGRL